MPEKTSRPGDATDFQFQIRSPLRGKLLLLPIIGQSVTNAEGEDVFSQYQDIFDRVKTENEGKQPSEMEALRPARNFFKGIGLDPTKTRPSSESLIRRILKGLELFSVNRLVDLANVCSVETGLPVGLYDAGRLSGKDITLRLGKREEEYESLGRGLLSLYGKPLLADAEGPFGMPISDSVRTGMSVKTTQFLFIFFAPADYDRKLLMYQGLTAANRLAKHGGGTVEISGII